MISLQYLSQQKIIAPRLLSFACTLCFRFFFIFSLYFTSLPAQATTCNNFADIGGTGHCINAIYTVPNISFADSWGSSGPPQYFVSDAAAIADLNKGSNKTGSYAEGWSTDTPMPAQKSITDVPINSIWTEYDKYGNVNLQEKGVEALDSHGVPFGKWVVYKIYTNDYFCPAGSNLIPDGKNPQGYPYPICYFPKPVAQQCKAGSPSSPHPCSITSGNKFKPQEDWRANIGPLQFKRNYNSLGPTDNAKLGGNANSTPFGAIWTHNYNLQLLFLKSLNEVKGIVLMRPNGLSIYASNAYTDTTIAGVGGWFISRSEGLKLNHLADNTWQVINVKTNDIENYDANGRLTKISYRNGHFVILTYPATIPATQTTPAVVYYNISQVTDNFGQSLIFTYNPSGYLTSVTLPTGKLINYTYDTQNRLSTVDRPGYGIKTYLYSEDDAAPSGNPNLLTGIVDEKGTRFESYAYDSSDRGILTSMAGGVETYRLIYGSSGYYNIVTNPRGSAEIYTLINASGSTAAGTVQMQTNAGATTVQEHSYTYDSGGNIASDTYYGVRTNYTYDLARNLEISRTEAVGKPQQRIITTQYDPVLPVPILITEPGRTTAYTYDANGNVLTRTITDTTTNTSRAWTYTYNSASQKLTETNPAGQTTTYSYDPSGNGNLLTVTDALGHITTYSNYNASSQPQQVVYANGHQISYTYDDAGRVTQTDETVGSDAYQTTDGISGIHWPQMESVAFIGHSGSLIWLTHFSN